ncbi:MAG: uracil-DNA glycosylase family protein [Muribaculaceae bacterium]|nr:uracil-DNA glycosylase family protein [Muribaculaceae bacterium]
MNENILTNLNNDIETHPWEPFIPEGAKVLIMGTFPPGAHRWNMNFYYPNRTNDFWKIIGLIFYDDPGALLIPGSKDYDLDKIICTLSEHHIAMNDTVYKARRLKGNASDKFLEIIEPVDLKGLLEQMPDCRTVATTGEKAAQVVASLTDTPLPKMGEHLKSANGLEIWRMPSTSRAFPMSLEKKAEYYRQLLLQI